MKQTVNDFDKLLLEVMDQAVRAGLPIARTIAPHVLVNRRAQKRFGQCIMKEEHFTIELSAVLLNAPEQACRQTLAHELIHTCRGCQNHGPLFQKYAAVMNRLYGYHIRTTNSMEEMGISDHTKQSAKYILQCLSCGKEYYYYRSGRAVEHPSSYRCRCGGRLTRTR